MAVLLMQDVRPVTGCAVLHAKQERSEHLPWIQHITGKTCHRSFSRQQLGMVAHCAQAQLANSWPTHISGLLVC